MNFWQNISDYEAEELSKIFSSMEQIEDSEDGCTQYKIPFIINKPQQDMIKNYFDFADDI